MAGDDTEGRYVRMDHDARRSSILAAAQRIFCASPYSTVRMAEIADEAGVARGLLHHYFGSKRDLYVEVLQGMVRVPGPPLPVDADGMDVAAVWELAVEGWMALMEANRELWLRVLAAGSSGHDPEIDSILDEAREAVAVRALRVLRLDTRDRPALVALTRGYGRLAEEVIREWLDQGRLDRDQARAILLATLPLLVAQVLPEIER